MNDVEFDSSVNSIWYYYLILFSSLVYWTWRGMTVDFCHLTFISFHSLPYVYTSFFIVNLFNLMIFPFSFLFSFLFTHDIFVPSHPNLPLSSLDLVHLLIPFPSLPFSRFRTSYRRHPPATTTTAATAPTIPASTNRYPTSGPVRGDERKRPEDMPPVWYRWPV